MHDIPYTSGRSTPRLQLGGGAFRDVIALRGRARNRENGHGGEEAVIEHFLRFTFSRKLQAISPPDLKEGRDKRVAGGPQVFGLDPSFGNHGKRLR